MEVKPFKSNVHSQLADSPSFLATGRHSDLTIVCGDREFKVHKFILESSRVLRLLVTGEFKEAKERSAVLHLHDDDVDALDALIHFLYNFTYKDSMIKEGSNLCFAVKAYAIADKYDIKELQDLAIAKFANNIEPNPDNLEEIMAANTLVDDMTADQTLWNIVLFQFEIFHMRT